MKSLFLLLIFFFSSFFLKAQEHVLDSSDVLLLHKLVKVTKNKEARVVYTELIKLSETRWSTYKKNPNVQPPFNYEELPLLFSNEDLAQ